ncbi:hypothetical protein JZX76_07980 [Haloarcula hispanica]|uniref:Uncharacterized protein n=1 Tax=Haloarcula hispanica TaxID=51589 RepID=A0A482TAA6_HALHI|nr:hypothetical protein [Haloarcula hispanica]MCJ0619449.1 hypothetical protein [Haloarcula hispanica]RYJ09937.1 hypothetical protein ELS20_07925 [Haloarcula hispanica]
MPTVEKTEGGRVTVRGIGEFGLGDQVEVSKDDAAYLCDERADFERVDDAAEEDGASDEANPPFDPSASTVDEIEAALEETNHHPVALQALLDAEKDGKNRDTAVEAIEAALSEED